MLFILIFLHLSLACCQFFLFLKNYPTPHPSDSISSKWISFSFNYFILPCPFFFFIYNLYYTILYLSQEWRPVKQLMKAGMTISVKKGKSCPLRKRCSLQQRWFLPLLTAGGEHIIHTSHLTLKKKIELPGAITLCVRLTAQKWAAIAHTNSNKPVNLCKLVHTHSSCTFAEGSWQISTVRAAVSCEHEPFQTPGLVNLRTGMCSVICEAVVMWAWSISCLSGSSVVIRILHYIWK